MEGGSLDLSGGGQAGCWISGGSFQQHLEGVIELISVGLHHPNSDECVPVFLCTWLKYAAIKC